MKASELRELTTEELATRLEDATKAIFDIQVRKGFGDGEQPLNERSLRRERARIKTVIRERQDVK